MFHFQLKRSNHLTRKNETNSHDLLHFQIMLNESSIMGKGENPTLNRIYVTKFELSIDGNPKSTEESAQKLISISTLLQQKKRTSR